MKTKSIILQTLSVPCSCHCRYCLLSWDNHPVGAEYSRSKEYALRFYQYLKENRPELEFHFTFGYSMEHPMLMEELDFLNEIGSVQGKLLQLDGLRFRSESEAMEFMHSLVCHGVQRVNFTFYGTRSYHDRFAGRAGDFDYLLLLAQSGSRQGLETSVGIPLTGENAGQVEELIGLLEQHGIQSIFVFVPHEEGRGASLSPVRFTEADLRKLGEKARAKFNRRVFKTEQEWCGSTWPEEENRSLLISLTPDNIGRFEKMDFDQVIQSVEALDEAYYNALPSFGALCRIYGNPNGTAFYSKRDLFRHYQRQYIAEHRITVYDVTDERFSGSRRY